MICNHATTPPIYYLMDTVVMRPKREPDLTSPPSVEVTNACSFTTTPSYDIRRFYFNMCQKCEGAHLRGYVCKVSTLGEVKLVRLIYCVKIKDLGAWFHSVTPAKCRYSTLKQITILPSTSSPIHHS
jgi:hypothetical protein